jgi:uncharacterized membrane protein
VNQKHGWSERLLDVFILELVCTARSTIDSDFYNTFRYCCASKNVILNVQAPGLAPGKWNWRRFLCLFKVWPLGNIADNPLPVM